MATTTVTAWVRPRKKFSGSGQRARHFKPPASFSFKKNKNARVILKYPRHIIFSILFPYIC